MKNPDPLSRVLQSWKHDPAPAPDFNKAVWARIRSAEVSMTSPSEALAKEGQLLAFPRQLPLAASFAVLLAGLAGTGAALTLNHGQSTDRMAAAYVRSIDPLQMSDAPAAPHSHS
jgi:hypothetical protein